MLSFSHSFVAALLLFLSFFNLPVAGDTSTYSQAVCVTALTNTKPSSVPTVTQAATLYLQRYAKTTTTPTLVVTPTSTTVTIVATSTTSKSGGQMWYL